MIMTGDLKRVFAEREQFIHIYSQNLKEPLRITANFVQLLMVHNSGNFDDTSKLYIEHILKSIHRMETMIRAMLQYAEADATQYTYCEVKLSEVLGTIQHDFTLRLRDIEGSITVGDLPSLRANPTQIHQLFTSLVDNAIKFRGKEPLHIRVAVKEQEKVWEISVRDNGIGIAEEDQKCVFDLFKRLNSQSDYEYTGLDLWICQKIVEAHGGTITAHANPTGGCEFKMTFPKESL